MPVDIFSIIFGIINSSREIQVFLSENNCPTMTAEPFIAGDNSVINCQLYLAQSEGRSWLKRTTPEATGSITVHYKKAIKMTYVYVCTLDDLGTSLNFRFSQTVMANSAERNTSQL